MSSSRRSSNHGIGGESDNERYRCRLCPGASFTAAGREIHRRVHRRNPTDQNHRPRPGPQSRQVRMPSPPGTDSTIFTTEPRRSVPIHSRPGETDADGPPTKMIKPGPKTRSQMRVLSPPGSGSTLFTPDPSRSDEDEPTPQKRKPGPKSKTQPGGGKKIRSRKNYRTDVLTTVKFTGA